MAISGPFSGYGLQPTEAIYTKYFTARVVTSTWRIGATPEEMDEVLTSQGVLPGRVIDVTPDLDDQRDQEIQEWLGTWADYYDIKKIAILDDRSDLGPLVNVLVMTSQAKGLTEQDASLVIQYLNSKTD